MVKNNVYFMRYETEESINALIEEINEMKLGLNDADISLCTISCGRDIGKNQCRGCIFTEVPPEIKPGYCYRNTDEVLNSLKTYKEIKNIQESNW